MLQVRNLIVRYPVVGATVEAIGNVSFDLVEGETVGLLGESGCGKTTLALAIPRLLPRHAMIQGSIRFGGQDLLSLAEEQLLAIRGAEISVVFQEPAISLNPVLRIGHQVAEVLRAHPPTRSHAKAEAALRLAEVRLGDEHDFFGAFPHELSGGQRQRVGIAQALACRPKLLVADEPTAALDTTVQAEIVALLKEHKARTGMALLFITHNPALLSGLADRVLVMYAGQIVEEGHSAEVLGSPRHPYTAALLGAVPPPPERAAPGPKRSLPCVKGGPPDLTHRRPGCAFEPRCPDRMAECAEREPSPIQLSQTRRLRCFKYGG